MDVFVPMGERAGLLCIIIKWKAMVETKGNFGEGETLLVSTHWAWTFHDAFCAVQNGTMVEGLSGTAGGEGSSTSSGESAQAGES